MAPLSFFWGCVPVGIFADISWTPFERNGAVVFLCPLLSLPEQVLERLPEAPTLLLVGFSTDRCVEGSKNFHKEKHIIGIHFEKKMALTNHTHNSKRFTEPN